MSKDNVEKLYEGREHSRIKHEFLREYVKLLAIKIGMSGTSTINFVDGFAGPWGSVDEAKRSDTSFGVAIKTLEDVRGFMFSKGRKIQTRYFLCEKDPEAHTKLASFAEAKGKGVIALKGAFEDNLSTIDAAIDSSNDFTFTLVDPKGWKMGSNQIFDFLRRQRRSEVLLNFMSDHINRHAEFPGVQESFGRFLGNVDWVNDYDELPDVWRNERRILHLFKSKLKAEGIAHYCPDMPIEHKDQKRTKMRLVLGTQHPKGVHVFRDVHEKMRNLEVAGKAKRTSTPSLFEPETFAGPEYDDEAVGSDAQKYRARELITALLGQASPIAFKALVVGVMEEVGVRPTHVKDVLIAAKSDGLISFELSGRSRKPNDSTMIYLGRKA